MVAAFSLFAQFSLYLGMEIWKDIQGFEGKYQVSNLGRVKSFVRSTPKILKAGKNSAGYMCVALCEHGKCKSKTVHRLVLGTFTENVDGKESINHINGDKNDNNLDNLEWATLSENMQHAYDTKLKVVSEKHRQTSIENIRKSARDTSRVIVNMESGVFHNSIKEASETYGFKYQTLASQINGQNRNRTALRYA